MKKAIVLSLLLLSFLFVAVYHPAVKAGFVDYDDPAFVTQNGYVNQGVSAVGVRWAFTGEDLGRPLMHEGVGNVWHPLTWISHMFDVQLFGLDQPGWHHVVSLLWHFLGMLLVFYVALALFDFLKRKDGREVRLGVAFFTAAIFAIHPLHVESAAWISERKDVLSGFFFFASLFAYLKGKAGLSVLLFIPALLAKPSVVVLPLILHGLDWYRAKLTSGFSVKVLMREVRAKLGWWIPAGLATLLGIWVQYQGSHADFIGDSSLLSRVMTMGAALLFYLLRVVWPVDLAPHYPYPSFGVIGYAVSWAVVIGGLGLIWRRRESYPDLFLGVLWFVILWLPVSGLVYVGTSFTADRYTYLGLVGLAWGLGLFLGRFGKLVWFGFAMVIGVCAFLAFQQVKVWQSSETLFAHAAKVQPRDGLSLQNYATVLKRQGRMEEAAEFYDKAVEVNPNDYIVFYNLGQLKLSLGKSEEARNYFERSLAVYPSYYPSMVSLGRLLSKSDPVTAQQYLQQAWTLSKERDPATAVAILELLLAEGRNQEAQQFKESLPEYLKKQLQITPTP